jgi:diguanylate cyclase (GGDEF)-like protein
MTPAPINVTVSIGVAGLKDHNQALEALIDCADRALYAAKQGGRNQVRVLED